MLRLAVDKARAAPRLHAQVEGRAEATVRGVPLLLGAMLVVYHLFLLVLRGRAVLFWLWLVLKLLLRHHAVLMVWLYNLHGLVAWCVGLCLAHLVPFCLLLWMDLQKSFGKFKIEKVGKKVLTRHSKGWMGEACYFVRLSRRGAAQPCMFEGLS